MEEIKVGKTFSGVVKDLASDGRGVVTHPQGRTFFVPGVWLGETGEFRIAGLKGRIGFAEVITLEESSRHTKRVDAPCPHHGHCGGCPWQFIEYGEQLAAKQARVEQAMRRLGCDSKVLPIIPSSKSLAYRNRAQLKTDGNNIGYMAVNSNRLVGVESCPILSEKNQSTLAGLLAQLPNRQWKPEGKHKWITLDIDESVDAETASINSRLPFQQGNSEQNKKMCDWLSAGLGRLEEGKTVLELFCGSGNLTEVIARSGAKQVFAVEVVEAAVDQLKHKKLEMVLPIICNLFSEQGAESLLPLVKQAEVLVLDPPREGLKISSPLFSRRSAIRSVFYISCDLATFGRDLAEFIKNGFRLKDVQPLDMFPHTPHIELMAELYRN
ncbi:class I SAM-dependent RNA methyltransferase [Teredinibacter haidensis]|uniref:class I SAM-dependent RNA methyltransferase n=1 Tax=Teredinibacter haidensis TaxID=2731755 RepID=UPI000948A084|nr:RsmD family RNA methyltransferase [Teredinibacter haidensis]